MTEPEDQQSVQPRQDAPQQKRSDVRLATHLPNTLILGDLTITPEGTAVPFDEVDDVIAVAAANGVPVYLMED